jgi:hypothetical protein
MQVYHRSSNSSGVSCSSQRALQLFNQLYKNKYKYLFLSHGIQQAIEQWFVINSCIHSMLGGCFSPTRPVLVLVLRSNPWGVGGGGWRVACPRDWAARLKCGSSLYLSLGPNLAQILWNHG